MSTSLKHLNDELHEESRVPVALIAELKSGVFTGGPLILDYFKARQLLALLEEGLREHAELGRIRLALEHLSEGCAYPREIRRRLREISEGRWSAPERVLIETQNGGFDSIWGQPGESISEKGISSIEYAYKGALYRVGFCGRTVQSVTLLSSEPDSAERCLWREGEDRRRLGLKLKEIIAGASKYRYAQAASVKETR